MNSELLNTIPIKPLASTHSAVSDHTIPRFIQIELPLIELNEDWLNCRLQSKQSHRTHTDVIKQFVAYAANQGSKNRYFYYTLFTKMIYKALGFVKTDNQSIRNGLNQEQLLTLMITEEYVADLLEKHMTETLPYKKIFILIRDRLAKL